MLGACVADARVSGYCLSAEQDETLIAAAGIHLRWLGSALAAHRDAVSMVLRRLWSIAACLCGPIE